MLFLSERSTPTRSKGSRFQAGFTLIELLVVIAIIAILAAILFPVFAQAREKARATTCLSNMKQIGTAFMMYVQDYDETYPLAFGNYPGLGWLYGFAHDVPYDWENIDDPDWKNQAAVGWANSIQPYVKNYNIYACPSAVNDVSLKDYGWNYTDPIKPPVPTTYTYNGLLMAYSMAGVIAPTNVPLVIEGLGKTRYIGVASNFPELRCADSTQPCRYQPRANGGCVAGNGGRSRSGMYGPRPTRWIHSQGQNMTFADGHAKWRKLGSVFAPGDTDASIDPFTQYNPDGTVNIVWTNGCHHWLFRPDFQP